jgi:hypothetical protein
LLSEASNLVGLYDFMDNALSLITNCKTRNDTAVLEGSSEICQLFILLLTSPSTSVHTRTKVRFTAFIAACCRMISLLKTNPSPHSPRSLPIRSCRSA